MYAFGMKLTRRGQAVVTGVALFGFLLLLGFAGWVEGLGA